MENVIFNPLEIKIMRPVVAPVNIGRAYSNSVTPSIRAVEKADKAKEKNIQE